ncbi:MAG: hypothetical protein ABJA82_10180 [Myxococcales bacterium]
MAGGRAVLAGCGAAAALVVVASPATAFVKNCHQAITAEALEEGRWPLGATPPELAPEYVVLKNELSIDVPGSANNLWSMSALAGNQYSDGGSVDAKDVVALAELAARPELQREHCLRATADDGPEGDAQALAACKAHILEEIGVALGDGEDPDLAATETVRLHLVFRGDADIPFHRFAFHLGRATHALQDSFTHAFRTPDKRQVRTVLNWVDWLKGGSDYVPARDGFQHLVALDKCGASDEGGPERRAAARQATDDLIAAVSDDAGARAGRMARVAAVVDGWFGVGEVCTAANAWCDAPEQTQISAGCDVAGAAPGGDGDGDGDPRRALRTVVAAFLWTLAALTMLGRRRRRRPGATRHRWTLVGVGALTLSLAAPPSDARADADAQSNPPGEVKGEVVAKAEPHEQRQLESRRLGILVGGGVSIDNASYNLGVGVRYDLGKRVTVGLDVEYNPWLSIETNRRTAGTTNAAAVGVYRLDVLDYIELRATLAAGVSVLMFDTWAAKKGRVGPFFAISPLGVAIRMNGRLRLIIDPAELVFAVPQTAGIPLVYRQHRFAVAVQANF